MCRVWTICISLGTLGLVIPTLSFLTYAQLVCSSYHRVLSHLLMWIWDFPPEPSALFCLVSLGTKHWPCRWWCVKLGLVNLSYPGIMAEVEGLGRQCLRSLLWTTSPCVTWWTAHLSSLLHRPPNVSCWFLYVEETSGTKVTPCLPNTRCSAPSWIAFHLHITRLD